jgi:hypothetical protein
LPLSHGKEDPIDRQPSQFKAILLSCSPLSMGGTGADEEVKCRVPQIAMPQHNQVPNVAGRDRQRMISADLKLKHHPADTSP